MPSDRFPLSVLFRIQFAELGNVLLVLVIMSGDALRQFSVHVCCDDNLDCNPGQRYPHLHSHLFLPSESNFRELYT